MVVNIARAPIGSTQKGMQRTDDVHEGITHQKEEVNNCSDAVHRTHQNSQFGD